MVSLLRAARSARAHVFKDDGLWTCRSVRAAGYGYTWKQAAAEWNAMLTSRHGLDQRQAQPLNFHIGVPTHV